jgi:hypothetical protein
MIQTKLVNEYGAALSPAIEELDALTRPILQELEVWAMGIPEMDGRDWAIVRTYVVAEFERYSIDKRPITSDGKWYIWLATARKFTFDLRRVLETWLSAHPQTYDWERVFVYQWAHGDLTCMCAQIQIEKAMAQRKAQRGTAWQGGAGWQKIS